MAESSPKRDSKLRGFRAWLLIHWRRALRIRGRIPVSEEAIHLFLAGIVGIIGGLTNVVFYVLIDGVQWLTTHQGGDIVEAAQILDPWQRVVTPALGGLAAGLILHWGLRLQRNQRSGNYMEVVVAGDGRLPLKSALTKGFSSLVSLGTGASIGREGAIAQLGATFASALGQWRQWPPYRLRLMVACGVSAGIASAYNAPIGGAVFAAMIVLGNFSMNFFGPLVFSSVIATISSASIPGSILAYFSERYSRSMCSFMRKLLPSKVRSTSKTTSPSVNPRSWGWTLTSS